jgi:nucleoside-diphosphate-sugar epimerase
LLKTSFLQRIMPNVLILGATGYIGNALATSLVRSGSHIVYGLARTPKKARELQQQEIIPVTGSAEDLTATLQLIDTAPIDIVVDAAGLHQGSATVLEALKSVAVEHIATAKAAGLVATPKLGFVYVSGIWVHGSSHASISDLSPVGVPHAPAQPPAIVAWRPALEQAILASSDVLDVVIVRPALVYGGPGAIWDSFFRQLLEGALARAVTVEVPAELDSRPALVHVDDVARGLHAAVEKLPLISGTGAYPVFDLATSQESMRDILESAGRALGFGGEVRLVGCGDNLFMQAMSTTVNLAGGRVKSILGWEPKRFGFAQNMPLYTMAWQATQ